MARCGVAWRRHTPSYIYINIKMYAVRMYCDVHKDFLFSFIPLKFNNVCKMIPNET